MAHPSAPTKDGASDPSDLENVQVRFSRFFDAAFPRVYRFARLRLEDPAAVERVTADVLGYIVEERCELVEANALWTALLTRLLARIREETTGQDLGPLEEPRAASVGEAA
jgi:hypothetical protein